MGKNVQGESFLRMTDQKRAIKTVSETMTTASLTVSSVERQAQQAQLVGIQSPVMKKLDAAASHSIPAANPTIQDVEGAYTEVELSMSSNAKKKEKEKTEAQARFAQQTSYSQLQAPVKQPFADDQALKDKLDRLDVGSLMHEKDGKNGYERLIAKYGEIQTELQYIDDYQRFVKNRLDNEMPNLQPNDPAAVEIRKEQAKLMALYDIRAYYDVLGDMLNNRYYALLPQDKMEKLTYDDLRERLNKLYSAANPNEELIKYYQNLVRLRELDLSKEGNAKEREVHYEKDLDPAPEVKEDKRKPAKVIKEMAVLYEKLVKYSGSGTHLCDPNTSDMYRKKFLETYKADYDKFKNAPGVDLRKSPMSKLAIAFNNYQPGGNVAAADTLHALVLGKKPEFREEIKRSGTSTPGIQLSAEQTESIHELGRYVLQKGIEKNKIPFVNNLLQASPDQQLLMFFLLECGFQTRALDAAFFQALNNYKPDLERVKKLGTFENLSKAMRISIHMMPQLEAYGIMQQNIEAADADVDYDKIPGDPQHKNRSFDAKKQSVIDAMAARGRLLRMLYKNAGLHENMPPDMASDPVLRKKLLDEYKKIGDLCTRLRAIIDEERAANPQPNPQPDYNSPLIRADMARKRGTVGVSNFDAANEGIQSANEYVMNDAVASLNNLAIAVTWGDMGLMNIPSGGVMGLAGVMGALTLVMSCISYGKEYSGMTTADSWAQGIGLGGDLLGTTSSFLTGAGALTQFAADAGKDLLTQATNLNVAAGAFALGAGVVKLGVSATQWRRAWVANDEVDESKKALDQTLAQKQAAGQSISKDEERLQRFLTHQKRDNHIQEASAGMGVLTGGMLAVAGGLMMGTATAPVGAIVGIVAVGIDVITKISCWRARKHNMKLTVDEYLHLDQAVAEVHSHHNEDRIKNKEPEEIKDMVREEMLAMLGFSSVKDCYREICEEIAATLYEKGVVDQNPDPMYDNAVKSLNMKVDRVKGIPTFDAIFTKLMSHGG